MKIQIEEMQNCHLNLINLSEFDDFWNMNMLKEELLSISSYYIIAKCEDEIIGFAGINHILDESHLANIVVKKTARNMGIGTKLLEALIEKSRENSLSLTLEVNEKNFPAIHLYEKHGFEIVRQKKKILRKSI